jgi:alkanesulfonate monooxygenase SsuD/methylene tetrahydromethanopterin reductase-like flavin-dependent oxidoreductase (luciferase family)
VELGLGLGYAGATFELPLRRILRAEELGFHAVWTSETYSSDGSRHSHTSRR